MWGTILFSDSAEEVKNAMANHFSIIALVDDPRGYQEYGIVTLGVLLPPADAICAEIDGNYELAERMYYDYLNTQCSQVLGMILAALYAGKNLMLFLPPDESMNFKFINIFAQYFASTFGITIGSSAAPTMMASDPRTMANIANVLYSYDFIPFDHFCNLMPMGGFPSEIACAKMMQSLNYNFPGGMEQCVQYCAQYIANEKQQLLARQQNPTQLFAPVFRVNNQ